MSSPGRPDGLTGPADLPRLLSAVEDAPPVAAADVIARHLTRTVGARDAALLIADLSGRSLVRMASGGGEEGDEVQIAGTPAGRALSTQEQVLAGTTVLSPVTNRGEAIGVLEVTFAQVPGDDVRAAIAETARMTAYVIIANRRYTDLFEWGQRSKVLSLPAEIQRRLLPPSYTCDAGPVTIAGWLEPSAEVAGDTFDFSLERTTLHVSVTDAMGHGVDASLLATTFVGALRNGRRKGLDLVAQAEEASAALAAGHEGGGFVTGQLVRVDLASGTAQIVNAGHPRPLRLRDGEVAAVELLVDAPFGVLPGRRYRAQGFELRPGDRVVFLTDGVLERNAAGLDVAAVVRATGSLHARDAVQELMHRLEAVTRGDLRDDATALVLDWSGS